MMLSAILEKYSKDSVKTICVRCFRSPLGTVIAAADDNYLYLVAFEDSKNFESILRTITQSINCRLVQRENIILLQFETELKSYLSGESKGFKVPIKTFGSNFQEKVWKGLLDIPFGSTQTYGELAEALGKPHTYSRAIGCMCAVNPLLIVVPCHRIVALRSKGGYSCGVERKEWLINHEKQHCH